MAKTSDVTGLGKVSDISLSSSKKESAILKRLAALNEKKQKELEAVAEKYAQEESAEINALKVELAKLLEPAFAVFTTLMELGTLGTFLKEPQFDGYHEMLNVNAGAKEKTSKVKVPRGKFDLEKVTTTLGKKEMWVQDLANAVGLGVQSLVKNLESSGKFNMSKENPKNERSKLMVKVK